MVTGQSFKTIFKTYAGVPESTLNSINKKKKKIANFHFIFHPLDLRQEYDKK